MRMFAGSSPCLLSPFFLFASCLRRALLTGLTSNPHINDLHLDISGCEVRLSATLVVRSELKFMQFNPILSYGLGVCVSRLKAQCMLVIVKLWRINSSWKEMSQWNGESLWTSEFRLKAEDDVWNSKFPRCEWHQSHKQTRQSHKYTLWPRFSAEVRAKEEKNPSIHSRIFRKVKLSCRFTGRDLLMWRMDDMSSFPPVV